MSAFRDNWSQKKKEYEIRLKKRRKKNKVAKSSRKKNRGK